MAVITSRKKFAEYCLRQLGAPVIEINVAQEQIDDRIDDALQKFWEFHGDGSKRHFFVIELSEADITNRYIELPDEVIAVYRVLPFSNFLSALNLEYQSFITELMNTKRVMSRGIHGYIISEQYISTINNIFNREKTVRWNKYAKQLFIETDWETFSPNDKIIIEAFMIIDPTDFVEVWNDPWLKAYATALIKKQWGQNLLKYDGFQLPSGIVLNGRQIFDDANAEIQKLEDDLMNTWQLPVDFMVG